MCPDSKVIMKKKNNVHCIYCITDWEDSPSLCCRQWTSTSVWCINKSWGRCTFQRWGKYQNATLLFILNAYYYFTSVFNSLRETLQLLLFWLIISIRFLIFSIRKASQNVARLKGHYEEKEKCSLHLLRETTKYSDSIIPNGF